MRPHFILDEYLLERSTPETGPSFAEALRAEGCDVTVASLNMNTRRVEIAAPSTDRPLLFYGSYSFVRSLSGSVAASPGCFLRIESLSFSVLAARYGDWMLNDDFHLLPFAELRRRRPKDDFFLRPDKVTKSFTGLRVAPGEADRELDFLARNLHVGPEEIVVVAPAKDIDLECRFVIASGEVLAGSTYGWSEGFTPSGNVPAEARRLAERVARHDWQPDTVYTCDVAMRNERASIVECNAFSCSGLYACDARAVARGISRAVVEEFKLAN